MDNIHEKLQLEKSNCLELQKEINFFDELISDIEMRQVLFKKFEEYLVNKKIDSSFPGGNDFCRMIERGYLSQQLLDFAKFFDKDNRTYSFSFIVKHGANNFKEKHEELFKIWKGYKLESIRNKVFAHSQKDYANSSVEKKDIDDFINKTVILFKNIQQ